MTTDTAPPAAPTDTAASSQRPLRPIRDHLGRRRPTVRQLDTSDAAAVTAHAAAVVADTIGAFLNPAGLASYSNRDRWERILTERNVLAIDADDGSLAGIAAVHMTGPATAYIGSLLIAERRHGHGTTLLTAALDQARRWAATTVVAHTHHLNSPARALLSQHGFEHTATQPDAWSDTQLLTYRCPLT